VSGGTTFLDVGQQRILTFKLPVGGLSLDQAQVLIVAQSSDFDPVVELLGPDGSPIGFADDSDRDRPGEASKRGLIYQNVSALPGDVNLFVVVSSFDPLDQGTFRVSVNVNPRTLTEDEFLVTAEEIGDVIKLSPPDVPFDATDELVHQFFFSHRDMEFFLFLPQDADVALSVRPASTNIDPNIPPSVDPSRLSFIRFGEDGTALDVSVRVNVVSELIAGRLTAVAHLLPKEEFTSTFPLTRGEFIIVLRPEVTPNPADDFELVIEEGLRFTNDPLGN
jgi:hypothetical protein